VPPSQLLIFSRRVTWAGVYKRRPWYLPLVTRSEWRNLRRRLGGRVGEMWVRNRGAPSFGCANEKRSLAGASYSVTNNNFIFFFLQNIVCAFYFLYWTTENANFSDLYLNDIISDNIFQIYIVRNSYVL